MPAHQRCGSSACVRDLASESQPGRHTCAHRHCRVTWSIRQATVWASRRARRDGNKPHRSQLNATGLSCPWSPQRRYTKLCSTKSQSRRRRTRPSQTVAGRRRLQPQPARTAGRRAAAPGGVARSAPGGGARSEAGRCSAPVGAAGQWLACLAAEGVSPDRLSPCLVTQSPRALPADVYPPLRGLFRAPVIEPDRQRWGDKFTPA